MTHPRFDRVLLRTTALVAGTVLLTVAWTTAAHAQTATDDIARPEAVIRFYHGANGMSRPLSYELDAGITQTSKNSFVFTRPTGSRLCIIVANAHPALYSYSIAASEDTTPVALPSLTPLVQQLNVWLGAPLSGPGTRTTTSLAAARRAAVAPNPAPSVVHLTLASDGRVVSAMMPFASDSVSRISWLNEYLKNLNAIHTDVAKAQSAATKSDQAEHFDELSGAPDGHGGFAAAQALIRELPATAGRFNDDNLATEVRMWYRAALDSLAAADDSAMRLVKQAKVASADTASSISGVYLQRDLKVERFLLESLNSTAEAMVGVRDALRAAYGPAATSRRLCTTTTEHPMDITLSVTRKDTSEAKAREVGRLMQVHVSPIYDRPVIELIPIAFGIYAKRVPQFSLRNNVIAREEGDEFRFRAGTMMVANMVPFHPDQSVSLGVGVGFGFFGEGKPLSDFLVGSLVSYRDLFRVGLGFGLSELPNSLKRPAAEGDPLPSNAGNITDVVETKKRGAIFMLFNMTGLSVPLLK